MKNIVLIGMPAAGKSTIGVILAKTLGFEFIDTDLIIQKQTGRLLQEIIDKDGLDHFCICEERAVMSVKAGCHLPDTQSGNCGINLRSWSWEKNGVS